MSKSEDIITKLSELTQFIENALDRLQNEDVVDLSHLDGEVAGLCEETLTLPPEEAVKVQPVMGEMITKLERLGMALQDFQNSLKDQNG